MVLDHPQIPLHTNGSENQQFSMRVSRSCSLRLGESEWPQSAMK
jgi:hypothetical protein